MSEDAVDFRPNLICSLTVLAVIGTATHDFAMAGDDQFPYSIMAPEPGTAAYHRAASSSRKRQVAPARKPFASQPAHEHVVVHGSSGSVLPTPVPRTTVIPPGRGSIVTAHPLPQRQGPTFVPAAPSLGGVPNLPHGTETFQDRASRCAFQQGLYGVPATASSQYMGACLQ